MTQVDRTITTPIEAVLVVGICFGLPVAASLAALASEFRSAWGFDDRALVWTVGQEMVTAALALVVLRVRGYAVATLYPSPTWRGAFEGLWLLMLTWLGATLAYALTTALGAGGTQPIERIIQASGLTLPVAVVASVVNGTFEEVFLVGFLMRGLREAGLSVALGVMTLVRVSYHLYQGPWGALSVVLLSIVFGLWWWRTQRLWPLVFAHILCDLLPLSNHVLG